MPHAKTHEALENELQETAKQIRVGGIYAHFKNPDHHYKVIALAHQEATDKVCVVYQTLYGNKLLFVRDAASWLETPIVNGEKVPRFHLIEL